VPSVESAILTVVPRRVPLLSPAVFDRYEAFLARAFSGRLPRRRLLAAAGLPPGGPIPPDAYARAFSALTR